MLQPEPGQRVAQHLPGHPVQRVGDRQHGRGDRLGAVTGGLDRHRQRVSAGALAVEADRQAGRLRQLVDDAVARARIERARRVVHQHVVGTQLRQPPRLVDHPRQVRHEAGEGQAGVQAAARLAHGRGGRLEVLHVVQGVVQPEDLDAALGRAEDEAAHKIVGQRPRADQEPPAQCHLQGRRAAPRLDAADPLPWALGPLLDGGVEAAAAAHLERGEAGLVEDLGHLQHTRGGDGADQRLLGEQADRGVDDAGHAREMYRASRVSTRITSPTLTNRGTATTAPVSSVAGLVTLETVSPLTPGSVSTTFSSTAAGSCNEDGVPSTVRIWTVSFSRMYWSSSEIDVTGSAIWSNVSASIRWASEPSLYR